MLARLCDDILVAPLLHSDPAIGGVILPITLRGEPIFDTRLESENARQH